MCVIVTPASMSQEAREEKTKALSEGEGIARNSLLLANQTTTLLACLTDRIKEVRRRQLSWWSVCACLCLCVCRGGRTCVSWQNGGGSVSRSVYDRLMRVRCSHSYPRSWSGA